MDFRGYYTNGDRRQATSDRQQAKEYTIGDVMAGVMERGAWGVGRVESGIRYSVPTSFAVGISASLRYSVFGRKNSVFFAVLFVLAVVS